MSAHLTTHVSHHDSIQRTAEWEMDSCNLTVRKVTRSTGRYATFLQIATKELRRHYLGILDQIKGSFCLNEVPI